jgi:hypothetical protein
VRSAIAVLSLGYARGDAIPMDDTLRQYPEHVPERALEAAQASATDSLQRTFGITAWSDEARTRPRTATPPSRSLRQISRPRNPVDPATSTMAQPRESAL